MKTLPQIPTRAGTRYTQADRERAWNLRNIARKTWFEISESMGVPFGSVHYLATGSAPQRHAMKGKK